MSRLMYFGPSRDCCRYCFKDCEIVGSVVGEEVVGVEMCEPWQSKGFSSQTRATAAAVEFACPCTTVPLQTDSAFGASTANRSLVPDVRSSLAAHYFSHHRPNPLLLLLAGDSRATAASTEPAHVVLYPLQV
jgi:hypothetical protein